VLCNGTSDRMLDALAKTVVDDMRAQHKKRGRLEGEARDGWLVVDYGDVVVHLFSPTSATITSWKSCGAREGIAEGAVVGNLLNTQVLSIQVNIFDLLFRRRSPTAPK